MVIEFKKEDGEVLSSVQLEDMYDIIDIPEYTDEIKIDFLLKM